MNEKVKLSESQLLTGMVEYYRQRATSYEAIYYRDNPVRRKEIDDECTELSKYAGGKRVIELACGTGYWTQVMSRTALEIVACDISDEMLAEARAKELLCPVQFLSCDMFEIEYAYHNSFGKKLDPTELVVAGFWHSHQPKQLYKPWFRLLAQLTLPNGLIWLIDNNPPAEGEGVTSHGIDGYGNNLKERTLPDGSIHRIVKNYFSREEIEGQFATAGEIVSLVYGAYYWSVLYRPKRLLEELK